MGFGLDLIWVSHIPPLLVSHGFHMDLARGSFFRFSEDELRMRRWGTRWMEVHDLGGGGMGGTPHHQNGGLDTLRGTGVSCVWIRYPALGWLDTLRGTGVSCVWIRYAALALAVYGYATRHWGG